MYNQKREKVIDGQAIEYLLQVCTEAILISSLSDKFTNYSFYEYGCIPLEHDMVYKNKMGYNMNECDVHKENIEYYTNIFLKNREDASIFQTKYGMVVSKHTTYEFNTFNKADVNLGIIQKLNETFNDIIITSTFKKCCIEYTIHW